MKVQDSMMRDVHIVERGASLVMAAQQMVAHDIGFLPVVENGTLIGVITDRDIVARGIAETHNPARTSVGDIMSMEIVCCYADQDIEEARKLMAEHHISRLPVIDPAGGLAGVISDSTIDGGSGRKKSVGVTFHKEKTDSRGRPHKVPVRTIYVTGKPSKDEAVKAAVERFEAEQGGSSWRNAANSFDVDEAAPKGPAEPQ